MIDRARQDMLIKQYASKKRLGASYASIRKELEQAGVDSDSVTVIIRLIDDLITKEDIQKPSMTGSHQMKVLGYTLMLGGGILTIAVYFKLLSLGKYYMIAFIPIVLGYILIKFATKKKVT